MKIIPDKQKTVKSATSTKKSFVVKANADTVKLKLEYEEFALNLVKELETEYGCKLSESAKTQLLYLANDIKYLNTGKKHGASPLDILENAIYEVFETDTGCIIASTNSKKKFTIKATTSKVTAADNTVSKDDVDELGLYIVHDSSLSDRAHAMIENLKRKVKKGTYDSNLAVKLWQYLADEGVRAYDKEFGSGKGSVAWLNKATRTAIAEYLRDYYEEEVMEDAEQAVDSATEISCSSSVDTDEVQDIIRNAGITVYGVEKTRTHLGDEYKIILDTVDDCSAVMDALRNAGYSVKLDTIDGESVVFLFITAPDDTQSGVAYRVTFGYQSEIVYMDDETTDYGAILDACIDKLESEGKIGCFVNPDEYNEDEYVIGGNHGLALYTGGNFSIDKVEPDEIESSTDISASINSQNKSETTDMYYIQRLANGVVKELNDYYDGTVIDVAVGITEEAITFTAMDGYLTYIQPCEEIIANEDDLESDIQELAESIESDWVPRF